jgi:23S rRNA G2445 N2-methylase RlmL
VCSCSCIGAHAPHLKGSTENRTVNDNRFAALRCKDAIVDRIQRRKGRRPDSGPEQTGAVIRLFWRDDRCEIYLDTSGEPLPRRGYRKNPLGAPMQETLAAGVIMATNWKARTPFVNPMCGSGTLAVEAALIAGNRAPGLLRKKFGFMHSLLYDPVGWARLRDEAKKDVRRVRTGIVASDLCAESVGAAMKNAMTAGVDRCIDFRTCDFADTPVPDGAGVIIFNPGYGIRMGAAGGLGPLYRRIGDFLKKECTGYTGYVFTGTPGLAGKIGLKSRRRLVFFSGKLECRLYEYDLYGGK